MQIIMWWDCINNIECYQFLPEELQEVVDDIECDFDIERDSYLFQCDFVEDTKEFQLETVPVENDYFQLNNWN